MVKSMIQYIKGACNLLRANDKPTLLHKDNVACVAQIRGGYIKGDRTNHISPKFFYTHELLKKGDVDICKICSSSNPPYLSHRNF